MRSGHDRLGLLARAPRARARLGDVNVSSALVDASWSKGLERLDDGVVELDIALVGDMPLDWMGLLAVDEAEFPGVEAFSGSVLEVEPHPGSTRVSLGVLNAAQLTEARIPHFEARGVRAHEVADVMARMAGFAEHQIVIPELDDDPPEVFEVLVPLEGISVSAPFAIAGVTIIPREVGARALDGLVDEEADIESILINTDAWALTLHTCRRLWHADEAALATVDASLAWITVRCRYALATMPDGRIQRFSRRRARSAPRRGPYVVVRGLSSGRGWVRSAAPERDEHLRDLDFHDLVETPVRPLPGDRQALLSARRAATEPDQLARVLAIWEAIEFLVSRVDDVSPALNDEQRVAIKKALKRATRRSTGLQLTKTARDRLGRLLSELGTAPIMAKLRYVLEQEGIPFSELELSLLHGLRKQRNDVVHGRAAGSPDPQDVDRALAVVARIIVWRTHTEPAGADA